MRRIFPLCLAWSVGLFAVVNWIDFVRRPACFDCGYPRGVPFTLYFDATFNSIGQGPDILWSGVGADLAFALASGASLAWAIRRVQRTANN